MSELSLSVPPDEAPPKWADRAVALALLIVLVGVGYSLWCQSALIWDGSYQLAFTLKEGKPYAYLSRFHTLIIWQPVAWLSWYTGNVRLLAIVYGAPFLVAPVVGLAATWWIVRRQAPMMILWAAFGTLATPLPGQIFVINDSIFQQHLFWPVLMAVMVRRVSWRQAFLVILLVSFQFAHQIGVVLCAGLVATTLMLALVERRPADRRTLWIRFSLVLLLLIAVGLKTAWISTPGTRYYDSYAPQEAKWERIREAWLYGVDGFPLQGLVLAYIAALGLFAQWLLIRSGRYVRADLLSYAAALCLIGTAALWLYWASVPGFWTSAINYRRWLVPMTAPIYLCALLEMAVRRWSSSRGEGAYDLPPARTTLITRGCVIVGLACLFVIVLDMQSTQYRRYSSQLQAEVVASPHTTVVCGPLHWMHTTPLESWATGWQVLLQQGRHPTKWLIGGDDKLREEHLQLLDGYPPQLPVSNFTPIVPDPGPTGWFDLRDLVAAAQKERQAGLPGLAPPPSPHPTTRP